MGYVYVLAIILVLGFVLHYFTLIPIKQKIIILTIVLAITAGAVAYNNHTKQQEQKILDIVTRFKQGKTIQCQEGNISTKYYTLSLGTFTFIGKPNTPYFDQMVNIQSCH